MKTLVVVSIAAAVLVSGVGPGSAAEAVELIAKDKVKVFGTYYAGDPAKPTILLFHMASSSRAEYAEIGPRLMAEGYNALAIDQRSGGGTFGPNQTVETLGQSTEFGEALPDLEAALDWAKEKNPETPIVAWGSSYSAALVFVLAADHPDEVDAVMAFSPGEYIGGTSIAGAAAKVTAPIFVTSSDDSAEVSAARDILAASTSATKVQFVPEEGRHGSSTLFERYNKVGAPAAWVAVNAFLTTVE